MKHIIFSLLAVLTAAVLLGSCSDNDSYTPGEEPACGDVTAYFAADYKALYVYDSKPLASKDSIAVVRTSTAGSLSVPITFSGDTAVHVSSSAEFLDGKDTAYVYITAPNVEFLKKTAFTIDIPKEYANPYAEKDGTTTLTSAVLWSAWDVAVDTVLFYSANNEFSTQGCKIENLRGQNRFRFTNFLNSGNTLEFYVKCDNEFDAENIKNNVGELIPLSNYSYNTAGWWYFTNPGEDGSWYNYITPAGKKANVIEYISFWPGRDYSNIDFRLEEKSDTLKLKHGTDTLMYHCDYTNSKNAHYGTLCSWVDYQDSSISSNYVYFYLALGYLIDKKE